MRIGDAIMTEKAFDALTFVAPADPVEARVYHQKRIARAAEATRQYEALENPLAGTMLLDIVNAWMQSKIREHLDKALPKWLGMSSEELVYRFIQEECGGEYQKGEPWGDFLPAWVGLMYALYQWKYNVPSKEVIKELPLKMMAQCFGPFHEAGEEVAVVKLREIVLRGV